MLLLQCFKLHGTAFHKLKNTIYITEILELKGRSAQNKISKNSDNQNLQLGQAVQRRIGGQRDGTWNILYNKVLVKAKIPKKTTQYLLMVEIQ